MGCYKFASLCYEYPKGHQGILSVDDLLLFQNWYINQILSLNVFGISLGGVGEGKISRIPMFTEQILIELSYTRKCGRAQAE